MSSLQTSAIPNELPIGQLVESKTNPRKRWGALEELAASMKTQGVIEPLVVRPLGEGKFEIVAGARRYRAAVLAKLDQVPVRVREMSDDQVVEVQFIENLQREDLHPLEEATGYKALLKSGHYDVAKIAEKFGKSTSYIYQRLKLADLIGPAQKAFYEGSMSASHAILIARLQPPEQGKVMEIIKHRGGHFSVRELSQYIGSDIHLDLAGAPFKLDNAKLLTGVPTCLACPKRTGANPDLYPDVQNKNTCTDRACYKRKVEAFIDWTIAELQATGQTVLQVHADHDFYSYDGKKKLPNVLYGKDYRRIRQGESPCKAAAPGVVVAGADAGKVISVCPDKKCRQHFAHYQGPSAAEKARAEREKRKRNLEETTRDRIRVAVVGKLPKRLGKPELETMAYAVWDALGNEPGPVRRTWPQPPHAKYPAVCAEVQKLLGKLDEAGLVRFIFETVADGWSVKPYEKKPDVLLETARRLKINVAAIDKEVAAAADKPAQKGAKS